MPASMNTELRYVYDGSLAGFYCCVYESIQAAELPMAVEETQALQPSLFPPKHIKTDLRIARKVRRSIAEQIAGEVLRFVEKAFLSCLENRACVLLRFLRRAYREGPRILNMIGEADVFPVHKAVRHYDGEVHLLLGFVRFSDYGGALFSRISPKNFVLPCLVDHFTQRYPNERFMIYDDVHKAALVYSGGKSEIVPMEEFEEAAPGEEELAYRSLWKRFFDTVAIQARKNPRCQMTHMPKRYWVHMRETRQTGALPE